MSEVTRGFQAKTCWNCGKLFQCGAGLEDKECWCKDLPQLSLIRADADCLCPECLLGAMAQDQINQTCESTAAPANQRSLGELIEGEDYYRDQDRVVFTASYHMRRGYCCQSGCRHCPY